MVTLAQKNAIFALDFYICSLKYTCMLSRRLLRIKVIKSAYGYLKSAKESMDLSEKEFIYSINKTYELYHLLMLLPAELVHCTQKDIDRRRQKMMKTEEDHNPNLKFVENQAIARLMASSGLNRFCNSKHLSWGEDSQMLCKHLLDKLQKSAYYKEYMAKEERTFKNDLQLLVDFFQNELEDDEELYGYLEEKSIFWIDDIEFVLSMIIKSLKQMKSTAEFSVPGLYKNQDDEQFGIQLFRKVLNEEAEYHQLIDSHTSNWDLERIAFMDIVIMITALAEVINFSDIPTKVSLNEYIEIAKYYSTPNSSVFINGVLDKIILDMKSQNQIQKTGRGLVGE